MAKHTVSSELILLKFEKLFAKGSFQAALWEIEKNKMDLEQPELQENLRICKKEIAKERASEMVKKARRCLKQDKLAEALALFTTAHEITREAWIKEKIEQLQAALQCANDKSAALKAEQDGDYLAAADLFGRQDPDGADKEVLLRKAHCLVMAREWEAAVSTYTACEPKSNRDLYDFGLALAMTGRYPDCLRLWSGISSSNKDFIAQRSTVCTLQVQSCCKRTESDDDPRKMYEQLTALLHNMDHPDLKRAREHCRCRLIERYWREERYGEILAFLKDVDEMDGALLEVAAKTSFLFVSDSKNDLTVSTLADFTMYWLSALHQPETWMQPAADIEEASRLRERLIERAESLVKSRADSCTGDGKKIAALWLSERAMTEDIYAAARDPGGGPCTPVYTPRFAARYNKTGAMSALIRENPNFLGDEERLLTLGAHYSKAAPALFCAMDEDYDRASEMLARLVPWDAFSEFALRRAAFACGLNCIDTADKRALKYFKSAIPILKTLKSLEDRLIQKIFETEEIEALKLCEKVLDLIIAEYPSDGLKKVLSTALTRIAVDRYRQGEIRISAMSLAAKRALALNPDNEEARIATQDAQRDLELAELRHALERHKMTRACEIVEKSKFPETRSTFFELMEDIFDQFTEMDIETEELIYILNDIYNWCERIDPTHSLLDEIREELDALNDQRGYATEKMGAS